ncbi:MAG: DUF1634 domain-containing protein [Verrucomicrobiales bacterium]|jgi:uncharacterized membrane protein|nr:DUF1634 domain-containing protein [Verrucomicrobiales bacterium]
MNAEKHDASRHYQTELIISNTLRIGVWTSLILIAAGCVLNFLFRPEYSSSPGHLQELTAPGTQNIFQNWLHLNGSGILVIGLLILIATPVLRVATSLVLFAREKDRVYTVITAVVLALLVLCFVLGKAG